MKKVLILGANGHLGYNLTKQLAEQGYEVRASVRDAQDKTKTAHLKELGVEIVAADLLDPASLRQAMDGMDGVFQLAAVYNVTAKRPHEEVYEPTVIGAQNVVRAAAEKKVGRLIFTSSITAVGTVENGAEPLTEEAWNDAAIEPYAQAKTESERQAWRLARELGVDMVAVLPGTIIGPGFVRHTPSTLSFELLLRGKVPFALPMTMEFVDVRDVARAHILAYENAHASGRYIVSNKSLTLRQLFDYVKQADPDIKVPEKELPSFMLGAVPLLDWLGNKLEGTPRFASSALLKEYANRAQRVSTDRIRHELDWAPMPIEVSVRDTLGWVRERFI